TFRLVLVEFVRRPGAAQAVISATLPPMTVAQLASEIELAAAALPVRNAPALRAIRREYSRRLKALPPDILMELGTALIARRNVHRFMGDELIAGRPDAMALLDRPRLEQLGAGMSSWDQVDCFACCLSGPAWREGRISDKTVLEWAHSDDRWWRRAALVSTVPLNLKARGGKGDPARTLRISTVLLDDRDDMVVKAL